MPHQQSGDNSNCAARPRKDYVSTRRLVERHERLPGLGHPRETVGGAHIPTSRGTEAGGGTAGVADTGPGGGGGYRQPHLVSVLDQGSGVAGGNVLRGDTVFGEGMRTHSLIMNLDQGQVRFIDSVHLEKGPDVKVRFY